MEQTVNDEATPTSLFVDPAEVPDDERLDTVYVRLEDISVSYSNPNAMDNAEFLRLVESIRSLGFVQPCVIVPAGMTEVDTDCPFVMADGYHRWKALAALDREVSPCVVAESWDAAKTIIARIALNKNRGNLNITAVAEQVAALAQEGYPTEDLTVTGYTEPELENMLAAMAVDVTNIDPSDVGSTSITDDGVDPGASPRPYLLELQFTNKEQRNAVRKALKHAGNGDISTGALALAGVQED